jgi:hypothetical protein
MEFAGVRMRHGRDVAAAFYAYVAARPLQPSR